MADEYVVSGRCCRWKILPFRYRNIEDGNIIFIHPIKIGHIKQFLFPVGWKNVVSRRPVGRHTAPETNHFHFRQGPEFIQDRWNLIRPSRWSNHNTRLRSGNHDGIFIGRIGVLKWPARKNKRSADKLKRKRPASTVAFSYNYERPRPGMRERPAWEVTDE